VEFTFLPGALQLEEGSGAVLIKVLRVSRGDSTAVLVRTKDGTAQAASDYVPVEELLVFDREDTARAFVLEVSNDRVPEADEQMSLELTGASGAARQARSSPLSVTIVDDDPAGPPLPVYWPMQEGSQWSYSVHHSGMWDGGGTSAWSEDRVDRVERSVRFKGRDYKVLDWGDAPTKILLRQEGSVVFYALAWDTLGGEPGSLRHRLRESLPWTLVDFLGAPGEWRTEFAHDSTSGYDFWYTFRCRTRFLGRSAVVGSLRVYRNVAVVGVDRSISQFPAYPFSQEWGKTLWIADSIGVVRETGFWEEHRIGWGRDSWRADLSFGPGRRE
jgi:hypothetical protein